MAGLIGKVAIITSASQDIGRAIAITAYTREVAADKVLAAGFNRFMPQHVDPEEIISTMLALL